MVCLREINGFLNRLFCILSLATSAPSHRFWGLGRGRLQETPEETGQAAVMKGTECSSAACVPVIGPLPRPRLRGEGRNTPTSLGSCKKQTHSRRQDGEGGSARGTPPTGVCFITSVATGPFQPRPRPSPHSVG